MSAATAARADTSAPGLFGRSRASLPVPPGVAVVACLVAGLLLLPSLLPLDPYRVDLDAILQAPSPGHPLGTDENGRDALARLLVGARNTLIIGTGGALVAVVTGALLGALAGYLAGKMDALLMRVVDFCLAFPSLFAILLFTSLFPAGPVQLVLLIGLTGWMTVCRIVRGDIREVLAMEYVEAAHALGAGGWRIMLHHLLPNTGGVLFVAALVQLNRSVLAEATISFLGLGIQPPEPTWGNLLIGAQDYLYSAPWLAVAPGLSITLMLLATYRLGIGRAVGPRVTEGR